MEHTRPGSSGLVVTRLSLGCMSFGDKNAGRITLASKI
jgi:aryl-alcohol dehydrogenase-like predicted oxidoreductase